MILTTWIQYSWKLAALPSTVPPLESNYLVDTAGVEDSARLFAAIDRAHSMEPGWNHDLALRRKLAEELIERDLPAGEVTFVAIKHGLRVIGAAAYRDSAEQVSHLPLGVNVLNEYRNRGLGTFLLYECLRRLRDRGLETARCVTKKGLTADRFLYPKFKGERVILEPANR